MINVQTEVKNLTSFCFNTAVLAQLLRQSRINTAMWRGEKQQSPSFFPLHTALHIGVLKQDEI